MRRFCCHSSSQSLDFIGTGIPAAWLSHQNVAKSLLEGNIDLESLNNCTDELQQQAYAQRQEEIVMKEKALRETRHEESSRTTSDKFSVQKLRECHEAIQRPTAQVRELQEKNYLNDSRQFHDVESNKKWKMFTRSQSTSMDSKSAINAELRQSLAT